MISATNSSIRKASLSGDREPSRYILRRLQTGSLLPFACLLLGLLAEPGIHVLTCDPAFRCHIGYTRNISVRVYEVLGVILLLYYRY